MRKAGVEDYESFARDILELVPDRPISPPGATTST
jgi:hypothetical protein